MVDDDSLNKNSDFLTAMLNIQMIEILDQTKTIEDSLRLTTPIACPS
jgi:hypothetical protein